MQTIKSTLFAVLSICLTSPDFLSFLQHFFPALLPRLVCGAALPDPLVWFGFHVPHVPLSYINIHIFLMSDTTKVYILIQTML